MSPTRTTGGPFRLLTPPAVAAGLVLFAGCEVRPYAAPSTKTTATHVQADATVPEPAPTAIPHPNAPKPDATRLRYDSASRTLEAGDPPVPGGQWMLSSPKEPRGVPFERSYQFPPAVDPDKVAVFYTSATGQASQTVSLREIVEAKDLR
jgi:hypothetical protein